jgi:carbon monoxide dehydrogenase subunit G
MPAPADATWAVLSDIAAVAACMPGAKITAKVDDTHYKGTVAVKLGPASPFIPRRDRGAGTHPGDTDDALGREGNGHDGSSFASMDLIARVDATDDGLSALTGTSEASVGGKAAAFGNRMMDAVSDQILKQFAANFAARVAALQPAAVEASPAPGEHAAGRRCGSHPPRSGAGSRGACRPIIAAAAPRSAELNRLALLWAIIRDWFRGLFSKRS